MTPGTSRGAGRANPLAASGPRNRMSSSVSIAAVPRRSTQVTPTLESIVVSRGASLASGVVISHDEEI